MSVRKCHTWYVKWFNDGYCTSINLHSQVFTYNELWNVVCLTQMSEEELMEALASGDEEHTGVNHLDRCTMFLTHELALQPKQC